VVAIRQSKSAQVRYPPARVPTLALGRRTLLVPPLEGVPSADAAGPGYARSRSEIIGAHSLEPGGGTKVHLELQRSVRKVQDG
jgi:hypothetical protein